MTPGPGESPSARAIRAMRSPFGVAIALLFAVSLLESVLLVAGGRLHSNDYKHLWLGSRILALGGNPYDPDLILAGARQYGLGGINPYVYLPATGMLMRPFSALPFGASALAWFALNFAGAWLFALRGPGWLRPPSGYDPRVGPNPLDPLVDIDGDRGRALARLAVACWLVGALPFLRQQTAGQMNVALLLAVAGAAGLLARGRDGAAGVLLGAASAFKIAPLFLVATLAAMRRGRASFFALASFVALCLVAEAWSGGGAHREFLPTLASMGYGRSTWSEFGMAFHRDPANQSFNSLFHRALGPLGLGPGFANGATWAASGALLVAFCLALRAHRRRFRFSPAWNEADTGLFLAASLLMLLLPSLMWDHYAVQTLAPFAWLVGSRRMRTRPGFAVAVLSATALLAWPIAHADPRWATGAGSVVGSIRLWGTILLLALVLDECARARTARPDS